MTIPQPARAPDAAPPPGARAGRGLASAIAVYLGGYLLLGSLAGTQLLGVSMSLFSGVTGRPGVGIPAPVATLLVLQFLFAIVVVVVGLFIGRGPLAGRLAGSSLVVLGSWLFFLVFGARLSGIIELPGGREGLPFRMLFANEWFTVVLIVGVAWLLSRRARLGWLSVLGVVVLIPLPVIFALNGIDHGVTSLVMYPLSALVGAGIIAAGRPLRD